MAVFNALTVVFLVVVGLFAVLGCLVACGVLRESSRRRRVVRIGRRTTARCVRSCHKAPQPAHAQPDRVRPPKKRFVLEFAGPDSDPIRFEDPSPPATTRVGDELTVAYLPDQPASAVVVAERERTALAELLQILAILGVFLIVLAGIASIGVMVLQAYASAAADPNIWIEP
ncbi:DUF3592 domain-containing protein [Streptomyces sp. WI04-05B]|uniref:DUF3592 domain-containing protein n=1 Tax=Streptomyces TaxID=1883 RepID=UPI0029AAAF41|nr:MULTISPECIES: DUF3592 domain-containing protein [unclassified Streptomyces]MDX2549124.1 DUF3592 domain-containing protein [Streptomyces sp. WI04-05B]MDX2590648.1 DUF3592 domain-containing protein [Streptomyces sp. WI04-05A]MDX3745712.1 DUF3592 domain-containing protein [Streptomyces sp. AK08-02]